MTMRLLRSTSSNIIIDLKIFTNIILIGRYFLKTVYGEEKGKMIQGILGG